MSGGGSWGAGALLVLAMLDLVMLGGCAAPNTPEACRIVKLAEVRLGRTGNLPVVEAEIAGRTARLLLDTGASSLLITEAARERFGLRYNLGMYGSSTSVEAVAPIRVTDPVELDLGGFKLKPTPFFVIASASVLGQPGGVDGLLGTSALQAYDVELDFPGRRMVLYEPRRCPLGPPPLDGASRTFTVSPNPYQHLELPAQIGGQALSLVVDTGASATFLNAARLGLSGSALAGDREVEVRSAGPDGMRVRVHRFRDVSVGGDTVPEALLAVGPLRTNGDGLVGMDYLRGRWVWLSFAGWAVTVGARGAEAPAPR